MSRGARAARDRVADCHFFYREPHCRPSNAAPTLAFWGGYAAGARGGDGRLPGVGPSCKWGAFKRLREGGYVREFARRARWPFAGRSAKVATRDGRLPGTRPARWPFARHPASEMAVCQAPGQLRGPPPTRLWPSSRRNLAKVGWAAANGPIWRIITETLIGAAFAPF
eukprot:COSAG02_NODE_918_length_15945_cov_5.640752_3_plen_168_part_00